MQATIIQFAPQERVFEDMDAIAEIFRKMGQEPGTKVITRAVGELATSVSQLSAQVGRHEFGEGLSHQLRRMQRVADGLGMVSLALVLADLRDCLASGDATAFAAVWARLMRVADRTLAKSA